MGYTSSSGWFKYTSSKTVYLSLCFATCGTSQLPRLSHQNFHNWAGSWEKKTSIFQERFTASPIGCVNKSLQLVALAVIWHSTRLSKALSFWSKLWNDSAAEPLWQCSNCVEAASWWSSNPLVIWTSRLDHRIVQMPVGTAAGGKYIQLWVGIEKLFWELQG